MIIPLTGNPYKELQRYWNACITGENGGGKTLLTLELAKPWLDKGWFFISNLKCKWNDNRMIERGDIDTWYQAVNDPTQIVVEHDNDKWIMPGPDQYGNICGIVVGDELGPAIRTKASVDALQKYPRKFKLIFIYSDRELPHEDLTQLVIYPVTKNNPLFQVWAYEIRTQRTKEQAGKNYGIFKAKIFIQLFPKIFWGIYSTGFLGIDGAFVLSWVTQVIQAVEEIQNTKAVRLQDMATGRKTLELSGDISKSTLVTREVRNS